MTELKTLINTYFSCELTEEQSRELSRYLVDSTEARNAIWQFAQQETLLEQIVEESHGDSSQICVRIAAVNVSSDCSRTELIADRVPAFASQKLFRWLSLAIVLLTATVASACVLPPARGLFVRWWQTVVAKGHDDKTNDFVAGEVDPQAKKTSRRALEAEQIAAKKNPVVPERPLEAKLSDSQKISSWEWDKFKWQSVDTERVRPVTFPITVSPDHKFVTVVVDDVKGLRVRNLLDAVEVTKIGGNPEATEPQKLSVEWNGMDDEGQPMPDGTYRIRGCSHPGMKLVYEYSFLNPGTPPWEHYPNSGWGGDHGFPHAIACLRGHQGGKWRVAIGGTIAEGGTPAFILGAEDRRVHGFGRGWAGPKAFAAADGQLWVGLWTGKDILRLEYHTGKQVPFKTPKGTQPALTFDADVWGIAVGKTRVVVRLHDDQVAQKERLVVFDRETGENRVDVRVATPIRRNGLAILRDGQTVVVATDGGMLELDVTNPHPMPQPIALKEVEKPGPLATDTEGNLYVLDRGTDYQVKVFSPDRKLIRTIGSQGGQGANLDYDRTALHGVEAISVDDEGCLWAAENGDQDNRPGRGFVRRIAVWDRNGKLVKDFVGTTWYGANNTCLHEDDPTLALGYGVVYKIEPGTKPGYHPLRYLTHEQPADAPLWHGTGAPHVLFGSVRMFRSKVSGQMREYVLQSNGFPILFQANERNEYRPVLSIGSNEHNKVFPQIPDEPKALFLWTDLNHDSKPQPDEFQRLPGTTYKADVGWGYPPSRDLIWYVEGLELKPVKFTENGVPIYDVKSAKRLPIPQLYLPVGQHLVAGLGGKFNSPRDGVYSSGHHLFTDRNGRPVAKYRSNWPAVHASWSSTPGYTPGQTGRSIGELFYSGIADANRELGHVVALQGNYGQSFLWSEDGLFVAALFKDSRQNPKGWGAQESVGADWTDISLMGECFGGWFGRQADGKVRYMFGRNGCHVVRVEGLEAVRRFEAGQIELKGPTASGKTTPEAENPARLMHIANVKGRFPPFRIDGDPAEWRDVPRQPIRVGDDVVAQVALAHSLDQLWILAEVVDPSPWKNAGSNPKFGFKTGDGIDIQLGQFEPERKSPVEGDIRILIIPGEKMPIVMGYCPVKAGAKPEEGHKFASPMKIVPFDSVIPVQDAQVSLKTIPTGYIIEVRLNCDQINLRNARNGLRIRGDIGVLWGNEAGLVTERRAYLFNRSPLASIVNDTPSEVELQPAEWGLWKFE